MTDDKRIKELEARHAKLATRLGRRWESFVKLRREFLAVDKDLGKLYRKRKRSRAAEEARRFIARLRIK